MNLPLTALAAATLLIACSERSAATWKPLAMDGIQPAQQAQMQKALAARDELAKELLGTLTTAIQEKGAAGAITVCREVAPRIAIAASTRLSVQIGRTSDRLRNPGNVAPAWATPVLATKPAQPTYVTGPAGELGALLPIRVQATCLLCHGPRETLAPDVAAQLAKLYEGDAATGYKVDDLRGWFWVEVPR